MEGWLSIFTINRLGLRRSHKRYFILKNSFIRSFKDKPMSQMEVLFNVHFYFYVYHAQFFSYLEHDYFFLEKDIYSWCGRITP